MKTFLIAVVVAAAAAFITYKLTTKVETATTYVCQTPTCEFIKLKIAAGQSEEEAALAFEKLLMNTVDPKAANGTAVRIRYHTAAGKVVEDSGPSTKDPFGFSQGNATPGCADGSMHNTQRVNAAIQKDYKSVIDSFDFSTTSAPATPSPTP